MKDVGDYLDEGVEDWGSWMGGNGMHFPLTHTLRIEYARWIPHVIVRLSRPPEEEEEKSSSPRIDKRGGYD
jgi:hypothetical protein